MHNFGCEFQPFVDGWKCGIPSHFMAIPWGIYGNKDKIRRWIWLLLAKYGQIRSECAWCRPAIKEPGSQATQRDRTVELSKGSWEQNKQEVNSQRIHGGILWKSMEYDVFNQWLAFFGGNRLVPQVLRRDRRVAHFILNRLQVAHVADVQKRWWWIIWIIWIIKIHMEKDI